MHEYGVQMFPTTFVISPDGIVSKVKFGAFSVEDLNTYLVAAT
jgi:hypothetical protein